LLALEKRMLSDEDAERLYAEFPEIKQSYEKYCPTCGKTGFYFWKGKKNICDCRGQLNLFKNYQNAGIGKLYHSLTWEDFHGDPELKVAAVDYLESADRLIANGIGIILLGDIGVGKTMAMNLLMKDLLRLGHRVYATTFASMISMFTAGWNSNEDKQLFERRIRMSEILLLDDLGKEMKTKTNLGEWTFDHVLRSRVQHGRPTFITTNMNGSEIQEGYGAATMSLLLETSIAYEVQGSDFRPEAGKRKVDEVKKGIIRPIV
jgi:DNA replication protein DnaC